MKRACFIIFFPIYPILLQPFFVTVLKYQKNREEEEKEGKPQGVKTEKKKMHSSQKFFLKDYNI